MNCKICEQKMRLITNTHLKKHGLTQQEYKEKYGKICDEDFSENISNKSKNQMKNFWNDENNIELIKTRREKIKSFCKRKNLIKKEINSKNNEIYSNQAENIDYVICKICGKYFKSLSGHIKIHNIIAQEYTSKYLSPIKCQKSINKFINSRTGYHHTNETKIKLSNKISGKNHPCFGRKHTEEEKEKIRISIKNKWRNEEYVTNQKDGYTQESRNKISTSSKNYMHNHGGREKTSISIKNLWKTEEHQTKMQKAFKLHPNSPEKVLINLFKMLNKPLQFVGDFTYWIDGKNPDFIDINNKIIVELYGDYWHRNEKNNNGKQRIEHFNKNGFMTLIIWESELKDIEAVKLIIEETYKKTKLDIEDGRIK